MAKAFSKNETEFISQKLIECCQACWERYGYKKTTVAQLCEMASISTGAFYTFYPSKELLFMATEDYYSNKLIDSFKSYLPEKPTKYDLKKALYQVFQELMNYKWLLSIKSDYELLIRRLPEGYLEKNTRKDLKDFSVVMEQYGFVPKVSMEIITAVINLLFSSLRSADVVGNQYSYALEILIDSVIDRLFE